MDKEETMKNETLEMMLNVIVAGGDKHLREFPEAV
jgi:hypothetical protein